LFVICSCELYECGALFRVFLLCASGKVDMEIELQTFGWVKNCQGKYRLNSLTYSTNNKVASI
jgi:hypothetical protein